MTTEDSGIRRVNRLNGRDSERATIVMSRDELDVMLAIDQALADRVDVHERPTIRPPVLELVVEDELEEVG